MIIAISELERIRAKLASFPPYDWEDDVKELLDSIEHADRAYEALRADFVDAERRATGNSRAYELTEKYHNEDMLLMREMEKVIAAAKRVVAGEGYAALADTIDGYEKAKRERDRTY